MWNVAAFNRVVPPLNGIALLEPRFYILLPEFVEHMFGLLRVMTSRAIRRHALSFAGGRLPHCTAAEG